MQGKRAGKIFWGGTFCAKLMEMWLGHKVAILSLGEGARDLKQASGQKKPLKPAN